MLLSPPVLIIPTAVSLCLNQNNFKYLQIVQKATGLKVQPHQSNSFFSPLLITYRAQLLFDYT